MIPFRLWLYIGGAAAVMAALAGWTWKVRHDEAERWRPKVEAARAQAEINDATAKAVDTYSRDITIIREKSDAGQQAVRQAPGADAPIPPAVLSAWLRAIDPEAATDGSGEPSGAVR